MIESLPQSVDTVVLAVSYMKEGLEEHFHSQPCGRKVVVVHEPTPLGTGGAIKNVAQYLDETFIAMNGDCISSLDLRALVKAHREKGGMGTIALWQVGGRTDLLGMLGVVDGSVATSGDYERMRIVDGRRYGHIIDPRTGYPAEGAWSSTVLAPTAEQADGLATAVFVLGAERGFALVESLDGVEAMLVDDQGVEHMTSGFRALFVPR